MFVICCETTAIVLVPPVNSFLSTSSFPSLNTAVNVGYACPESNVHLPVTDWLGFKLNILTADPDTAIFKFAAVANPSISFSPTPMFSNTLPSFFWHNIYNFLYVSGPFVRSKKSSLNVNSEYCSCIAFTIRCILIAYVKSSNNTPCISSVVGELPPVGFRLPPNAELIVPSALL